MRNLKASLLGLAIRIVVGAALALAALGAAWWWIGSTVGQR